MDLDPPHTLEYIAIQQCREHLVDCIAQSPYEVALQPELKSTVGKLLDLPDAGREDDYGKARFIVDTVQFIVQKDPQWFGTFPKVLKNAGPWTRTVVDELERTRSSLQNSGKLNCEAYCSMQGSLHMQFHP